MSYRRLPENAAPATYSLERSFFGWPDILRLKGSVLPHILPNVIVITLISTILVAIHVWIHYHFKLSSSLVSSFSVVLGLLLVFRTNSAYDRFYEGRKVWSTVQTHVRILTRTIHILLNEPTESIDRVEFEKKRALDVLLAFPVAFKFHLRGARTFMMQATMSAMYPGVQIIDQDALPEPLILIDALSQFSARLWKAKLIDTPVMNTFLTSCNALTDAFSAAERITTTPIPLAYTIHMKQAVFMYCLVLPLTVVDVLEWYAVPFTAIVAFTLLGIDGIGSEIEQPFGEDANDIPLDDLCDVLREEHEFRVKNVCAKVTDEMVEGARRVSNGY